MSARRGIHDADIIIHEEVFIGVCLGWDFTAEHEWGIKELSYAFSLNSKAPHGLPRLKINSLPEKYGFDKKALRVAFPLDDLYIAKQTKVYEGQDIGTAWSERDFSVAFDKKHKQYAKELNEAFERKDIAFMFMGAGGPFRNRGLCLMIASRLPQEMIDRLCDQDLEAERLQAADEATGIKQRLREAGKQYFALSPRFIDEGKQQERKTVHPVIYWLNPCDQDRNNHGWFTVEELDEWIEGKGPVPGGRLANKSAWEPTR